MVPPEILSRLADVQGKSCWHVGAGGLVGSSFSLALGTKVRRTRPLRNAAETDEAKYFEGEFRFLVWCTWRLEGRDGPLSSSDQESGNIVPGLDNLHGKTLIEATVQPPAWDLCLRFSDDIRLLAFCDHLPGDASIEQNWELWHGNEALLIGPGYAWKVQRES